MLVYEKNNSNVIVSVIVSRKGRDNGVGKRQKTNKRKTYIKGYIYKKNSVYKRINI